MAPSDNFFYTGAIFFNFCKKMNIDFVHLGYCPMRKFCMTLSRPFGENNVEISKN